jgi:transcriptional regulator with XRE-family HTH domain
MGKKIRESIEVGALYKAIYKSEGITQEELARRLGLASQSGVAAMIHKGVSIDNLYKMLQVLDGYRLVVEKVSPRGKVMKKYIIGEDIE